MLRGDLGISIRTRRAVADDLRDFLPATIELSVAALLVALVLGIAPNGQTSDGKGGIRAWAVGFFYASNHVEVHQSESHQTIIQHNAPPKADAEKRAAEDKEKR